MSRPYGTFGQPGNLTIPLYKKESFTVVCPVQGHCIAGMMFDVYVECPAPQGEHDGAQRDRTCIMVCVAMCGGSKSTSVKTCGGPEDTG